MLPITTWLKHRARVIVFIYVHSDPNANGVLFTDFFCGTSPVVTDKPGSHLVTLKTSTGYFIDIFDHRNIKPPIPMDRRARDLAFGGLPLQFLLRTTPSPNGAHNNG